MRVGTLILEGVRKAVLRLASNFAILCILRADGAAATQDSVANLFVFKISTPQAPENKELGRNDTPLTR